MNALLVALSLFATPPDSATETIRLQYLRPSELMATFNHGIFGLEDKLAVYGSDIDRTITLTGAEAGRNGFKELVRMLDVPKRALQLAIRIHILTTKDGKVQDEVPFEPRLSVYNNEENEVLFRAQGDSYRLGIRARVNNDGTTTVEVVVSRLDQKLGVVESSKLTKRLRPGENRGFGGILQDATPDAATTVRNGDIPLSGLSRGIIVELAATPK